MIRKIWNLTIKPHTNMSYLATSMPETMNKCNICEHRSVSLCVETIVVWPFYGTEVFFDLRTLAAFYRKGENAGRCDEIPL